MSVPVWVSEVTSTTWGLEGAPLILTELKKKKKKDFYCLFGSTIVQQPTSPSNHESVCSISHAISARAPGFEGNAPLPSFNE